MPLVACTVHAYTLLLCHANYVLGHALAGPRGRRHPAHAAAAPAAATQRPAARAADAHAKKLPSISRCDHFDWLFVRLFVHCLPTNEIATRNSFEKGLYRIAEGSWKICIKTHTRFRMLNGRWYVLMGDWPIVRLLAPLLSVEGVAYCFWLRRSRL